MALNDDKFIDLKKIIAEKNPAILKWMPGFIFRYIKRIIHQDEINAFINKNKEQKNKEFCVSVVEYFDIELKVSGLENIPKEGGCILAANHPLGGMDAMAIVTKIYDIRPDMKFIVNDILMNLDNLKDLFTGVDKHKANTAKSLQNVNELFASDKAVFVFPAGLVSRKKKGKIEDLEWKKTFISRSKKYNKPIIPIYIEGRLSNFFYRLANFRKFIGIKANIEMLYLADELFKQKGKTIEFKIGKPIYPEQLTSEKTDLEWAQWIKNKAYQLK